MSEQRAASATITTPLLRDSPRNTSPNHILQRSQLSTVPLRLSKHELSLTSSSIPSPRYHKLPSQLARRQSSSYNHVKNNALVSNSPFKTSTHKASRIPAPSLSRNQLTPEDENKPTIGGFHRRQSKGLHVLAKEQVVTKSPFRNDQSIVEANPARSVRPERGRSLTPTQPPFHVFTASSGQLISTDLESAYSSNVPLPTSSPTSRMAASSPTEAAPSPKSVLVSPKRLHGPRSLSASPGAELKAQRRKTVTFVELIDVLEFDKDEASDMTYSSADEYSSTDIQSSVPSPDNSFDTIATEIPLIVSDQPHLSSNSVEHCSAAHQSDEFEHSEDSFTQTVSDISPFDDTTSSLHAQIPVEPAETAESEIEDHSSTSLLSNDGPSFSTDLNSTSSNTTDLQTALDNLMLEAEKELLEHKKEQLEPESGSTDDDDNNEPATPREHNSELPHVSMENINEADTDVNSLSTLTVGNLSVSELHMTSTEMKTSSPPRKEPAPSTSCDTTSSSLILPPLSFDEPLQSSCSWKADLDLDMSPSKLPPSRSTNDSAVNSSFDNVAPPVPPKDANVTQQREELIKAWRRELRQRPVTYHEGLPNRRRSLSTGDVEDFHFDDSPPQEHERVEILRHFNDSTRLDVPLEQAESDHALGEIIEQELKLRRKPTIKEQQARNKPYKLREREDTIYATSDDKIAHSRQAGDVDTGKAWRTVRRPSDMNEHSQLIKQYRSQQKHGKAFGKVFVRVLGIRKLNIPMPNDPTSFTCTLNNGIHFVTTPQCRLGRDARIEQEFELIEHSKLEFKLTLKVHRTPEIDAQLKANNVISMSVPAALPQPFLQPTPPVQSSRNVRSFFGVGSSPRKHHKITVIATPPQPPILQPVMPPMKDNLARYIKLDGTLAQTLVSFKEIASRCDTRIFETSFPLIGQRMTGLGKSASITPCTVGEIVLKIFRLPPLPGIPNDQLPQSLEECHRGLQYTSWHKATYHEGILTQIGGDCRTWRRRLLRLIGSNLVAFNDVTKKATTSIDLKKAIAVEDDDMASLSNSNVTPRIRRTQDEFSEVYKLERSFRLVFPNEEEITFFADTNEAKQAWLRILKALIGHIPPNLLWAELVWQRQDELRQQDGLLADSATSLS